MPSPVEIASLYGLLELKDEMSGSLDTAEKKAKGFGERLKGLGEDVTAVGVSMSTMTAPFIAGMALASNEFLKFDANMTNVQSVLGKTDDEMQAMSNDVLLLGENSRSGAQAAAEAMYEIAGGVADANSHLAILDTSLDVAAANSADLDGAVSALVKTMNIYGFAAEDAAHVGDVFTRTVGMGVGTANEFAAALPPVEGLAKELGISFDDLGGFMAYMSTQSASVAEGGTQLRGVFSKLMNPSADLASAIEDMGYASGQALIEQEGLIGALEKIKKYGGGSFAGLITDQEALLGAIALTKDGADEFFDTFKGSAVLASDGPRGLVDNMDLVSASIDGATDAALAIQMASPAAQIDLLKNSIGGLAISVGEALMPAISDIVAIVGPIVGSIKDWVRENPELVGQIGTAIAVVGGLGAALTGLGVVIGVVGGAFAALTSPIAIALGAGAGLVAAYTTNFGGLRDFIDGTVRPGIETFFNFLGDIWALVSPALTALKDWFVAEGLPQIQAAVADVKTGIETVFNWLAGVWTTLLQPALQPIVDWFLSGGAWQTITGAVEIVKLAVETAFNWFAGVWTTLLQPGLQPIVDWFTDGSAWQTISTAVTDAKTVVEGVFNWLAGVWTTILQPALQPIIDWFVSGTGWGLITDTVGKAKTSFDTIVSVISGLWNSVKTGVEAFASGIQAALAPVIEFIGGIAGAVQDVVDALTGVQTTVGAGGTLNPAIAGLGAPGSRDGGGDGVAGQSYLIGTGAQPELFTPRSAGTFTPANQQGGGGVQIGQVVISANSEAEGAAAAVGLERKLREIREGRG